MARPLTFAPDNTLLFVLSETMQAQTTLRITNISSGAVVFKVKTTTPERYLVKPNHGFVAEGLSAEVVIIVVEHKKNEILAHVRHHDVEQHNDKFLVQSSIIDSSTAILLSTKPSTEVAEVITGYFSAKDKREINSKKLLVKFTCPRTSEATSDTKGELCPDREITSLAMMAATPKPGSHEAMFAELLALRKKYDDLVSFTVNLTAERDLIAAEVVELKSESNTLEGPATANRTFDTTETEPRSRPAALHVRNTRLRYVVVGCTAFAVGITVSQRWL